VRSSDDQKRIQQNKEGRAEYCFSN